MGAQASYWLNLLIGSSIKQRPNTIIEKKTKMLHKKQPFPIWRAIQISLLVLAIWIFGAMTIMPAFISHIARLGILFVLIACLSMIARFTRQLSYQSYLIALVSTIVGIPVYYLISPITGHSEWVFALIVIIISSEWGTFPGLTAALLSALEFGFISHYQQGTITDAIIMAGQLTVSAIIIGTVVKHREAALVARAHMADDLEKTSETTLIAFSRALDARDQDTEGHSERVAGLAVEIGREMDFDEADLSSLRLAGLLHDIGKIGIPDAILHKPGPLDEQEWMIMRNHPKTGHDILQNVPFLSPALDAILHHHEKINGKGYPDGLCGSTISLPARILAVVDVYDALTSNRPYRLAFSQEKTLRIIEEEAGQHFDPGVVSALVRVMADQERKKLDRN
jgi:putative nucleotidyltransferase with HDIG domain